MYIANSRTRLCTGEFRNVLCIVPFLLRHFASFPSFNIVFRSFIFSYNLIFLLSFSLILTVLSFLVIFSFQSFLSFPLILHFFLWHIIFINFFSSSFLSPYFSHSLPFSFSSPYISSRAPSFPNFLPSLHIIFSLFSFTFTNVAFTSPSFPSFLFPSFPSHIPSLSSFLFPPFLFLSNSFSFGS